MKIFGAIETGGTKTVCAIGSIDGELLAETQFPTRTPEQTFAKAAEFLHRESDGSGGLACIGVGTFGPVDINRGSGNYGRILNTPKPGWSNVDIVGELSRHFNTPVAVDTDVNCALLGEVRWGAGTGFEDVVYLTIGTGIGGGVLSGGHLITGHSHPEIGHMLIPIDDQDREFAGSCPVHGAHCAEGLASGQAVTLRWGVESRNLPATHRAWDLEARYLATLCLNLFLCVAPRRIILGGGVMHQQQLFARIRRHFHKLLNGYIDVSSWCESLDDLIVSIALNGNAGVLGACLIADAYLAELPSD